MITEKFCVLSRLHCVNFLFQVIVMFYTNKSFLELKKTNQSVKSSSCSFHVETLKIQLTSFVSWGHTVRMNSDVPGLSEIILAKINGNFLGTEYYLWPYHHKGITLRLNIILGQLANTEKKDLNHACLVPKRSFFFFFLEEKNTNFFSFTKESHS